MSIVSGVLSREHIHMFVEIPPHIPVSDFVRRFKVRSSPRGAGGSAAREVNDAIRDRFQKFRACHGARVRLGLCMRSWAIFAAHGLAADDYRLGRGACFLAST